MAERLDYLTEKDTGQVAEHVYRYWLACNELIFSDTVIDAACGFGYGTDMLADVCRQAIGMDYSRETIAKAIGMFPSVYFQTKNLDEPLNIGGFNTLVSFETIEHLKYPERFIEQFPQFEKIFLSTPIVPSKHTNSFHLHDFTEEQVLSWFPEDVWEIVWTKKQRDVYLIIYARKK